jgi:hypothetical protein
MPNTSTLTQSHQLVQFCPCGHTYYLSIESIVALGGQKQLDRIAFDQKLDAVCFDSERCEVCEEESRLLDQGYWGY